MNYTICFLHCCTPWLYHGRNEAASRFLFILVQQRSHYWCLCWRVMTHCSTLGCVYSHPETVAVINAVWLETFAVDALPEDVHGTVPPWTQEMPPKSKTQEDSDVGAGTLLWFVNLTVSGCASGTNKHSFLPSTSVFFLVAVRRSATKTWIRPFTWILFWLLALTKNLLQTSYTRGGQSGSWRAGVLQVLHVPLL